MNATANPNEPAILVDHSKNIFKVARRNLSIRRSTPPSGSASSSGPGCILGMAPRLPKPGDFVTRNGCRSRYPFHTGCKGRAARNAEHMSPSRHAQVCREKQGSAKSFQCFYHGWIFGLGR